VTGRLIAEGWLASVAISSQIALTHVKLSDGKWLLHGKKATGFTNSEEEAVEKVKVWLLLNTPLTNATRFVFPCTHACDSAYCPLVPDSAIDCAPRCMLLPFLQYMPFSIEDRIKEEGALYTKASVRRTVPALAPATSCATDG
jgi:hypothetical protein